MRDRFRYSDPPLRRIQRCNSPRERTYSSSWRSWLRLPRCRCSRGAWVALLLRPPGAPRLCRTPVSGSSSAGLSGRCRHYRTPSSLDGCRRLPSTRAIHLDGCWELATVVFGKRVTLGERGRPLPTMHRHSPLERWPLPQATPTSFMSRPEKMSGLLCLLSGARPD